MAISFDVFIIHPPIVTGLKYFPCTFQPGGPPPGIILTFSKNIIIYLCDYVENANVPKISLSNLEM